MATRKETRRKSLRTVLTLVVAVCIIVVTVVLVQKWMNKKDTTAPQDIAISAQVGDKTIDVLPYIACETGKKCPEGKVPNLTVGPDDSLEVDIPTDLASHRWSVLSIYDDPAANDETLHGPGETQHITVPGSVDPIAASTGKRPKLQLIEISALLIGKDAKGEETPINTVWSLSTMTDKELKASTSS